MAAAWHRGTPERRARRIRAVSQCRDARTVKVKQLHGAACRLCGYSKCLRALEFHHLYPEAKSFSISGKGITRRLSVQLEEAAKCVLLCANCHREVEEGMTAIPEVIRMEIASVERNQLSLFEAC